eukprot:5738099-Heterocapsa_arctica.AAC.1
MSQKRYWDTSYQGNTNKWDKGPPWAMAELMEDKKEEVQFKAVMQRFKNAESNSQGVKGQDEALKSVRFQMAELQRQASASSD